MGLIQEADHHISVNASSPVGETFGMSSRGIQGAKGNGEQNGMQEETTWPEEERNRWTQEALRTYLGLDTALKGGLIDFNLVPRAIRPKDVKPITPRKVTEKLVDLITTLPSTETDETLFLHAKLLATIIFVDEIQKRSDGKNQGRFHNVYRDTMGAEVEHASEDVVVMIKDQLREELDKVATESKLTGNLWEKLSQWKRLKRLGTGRQINESGIVELMQDAARNSLAELKSLGLVVPEIDYVIQRPEANEYWKFWVKGGFSDDGLKFQLLLNKHQRHYKDWTYGAPQRYAAHEISAHLVQMARWAKAIEEGKLNPVMGLTTIPGPEQFQLEGLAQTIQFFAEFDWSSETVISCLDNYLHALAWQTAYLYYENGASSEVAAREYRRIYPLANEPQIRDEMERVRLRPDRRTYQFVYGPSLTAFLGIAQELNREGRIVFLEKMFKDPMTPGQIKGFYAKLRHQYPS